MKAMITIFLLQIMTILTSRFRFVNTDKSPNNNATALYVFGDSLLDSGNNNLLPTLAKADFTPYGMSFVRGATGRFTNGRTVADFTAEFLGLPYAPPYLSIVRTLLQQDELTGINFASGSCGILTETGSDLGKCLSFPEQVNYFEKMVHEQLPRHYERSDELLDYLAKSILIVSVGSNDYINNYLDTEHYNTSQRYTPESFAGLLVDNLRTQFQRLYNLGARKVIMFEIGPIGCIPSSTRRFKHQGQCVEDFNRLAVIFNDRLASMLQNLKSSLQGSNFVLGRVHRLGYDAVIHPSNYGLSDSINPCCVTWLNGTSACIPELWALTCRDPNKHYFFDGFHLSETVYNTIATRCFNGSDVCIPNNIRDLVQQL